MLSFYVLIIKKFQNVNEATTDTAGPMSMGMIIVPPLPPGRALDQLFSRDQDSSFTQDPPWRAQGQGGFMESLGHDGRTYIMGHPTISGRKG